MPSSCTSPIWLVLALVLAGLLNALSGAGRGMAVGSYGNAVGAGDDKARQRKKEIDGPLHLHSHCVANEAKASFPPGLGILVQQ